MDMVDTPRLETKDTNDMKRAERISETITTDEFVKIMKDATNNFIVALHIMNALMKRVLLVGDDESLTSVSEHDSD